MAGDGGLRQLVVGVPGQLRFAVRARTLVATDALDDVAVCVAFEGLEPVMHFDLIFLSPAYPRLHEQEAVPE